MRAAIRADGKVGRLLRRGGLAAASTLVVLVFAATLLVAYGAVTDNRWYKVVAIEGSSMSPTLKQGDAVVVTRPPAHLKPGMIVVLQVNDSLVTHRVLAVGPNGSFTTKGDANDYHDDWSGTTVRVAGLVRADIPFVGRILRTIGSAAWLSDRAEVEAAVRSKPPAPASLAPTTTETTETTETVTEPTDTTETETTQTTTAEEPTTTTEATTTTTTETAPPEEPTTAETTPPAESAPEG